MREYIADQVQQPTSPKGRQTGRERGALAERPLLMNTKSRAGGIGRIQRRIYQLAMLEAKGGASNGRPGTNAMGVVSRRQVQEGKRVMIDLGHCEEKTVV